MLFDTVKFRTYFANGDLLDGGADLAGTIDNLKNIEFDVGQFEKVWKPGERYEILINGEIVVNEECY